MMRNFNGSNKGFKAEIRQSENPYNDGFSVFTWFDNGLGLLLWREKHEIIEWAQAFKIAQNWLNEGVEK